MVLDEFLSNLLLPVLLLGRIISVEVVAVLPLTVELDSQGQPVDAQVDASQQMAKVIADLNLWGYGHAGIDTDEAGARFTHTLRSPVGQRNDGASSRDTPCLTAR